MPLPDEQRKVTRGLLQFVCFIIGNEELGVSILYVIEIDRMFQITKIPNAPGEIDGIVNLCGRVILF